jgi:hypothetical protein
MEEKQKKEDSANGNGESIAQILQKGKKNSSASFLADDALLDDLELGDIERLPL